LYSLRLLFWLKWKLMLRGYRRNPSSAIGTLFMFLFFFPLAVVIAVLCGEGFLKMAPPDNVQLLRGVLLGIYGFWLMAPVLGYALNDAYDITKLFVFPLSLRQIFTGAIVGSLLDMPVLLLLPTLIAVLVGFTHDSVSLLCILAAVILFLLHTLSLSQGIILASSGVLRSRRFRDLVTILIPVIWIAWYVFTQMMTGRAGRMDWGAFLQSPLWEALSYLPPGLAAHATVAAQQGAYGTALGFLLGLLAFTLGTIYLAAWFLQKVFEGDVNTPPARALAPPPPVASTPRLRTGPAASVQPTLTGKLSPVVQAVIDKEIKYLRRDPYFKIVLMNLVYMLFVAVFALLNLKHDPHFERIGPAGAWGFTAMVLLAEMQLVCNIFGTEGSAATQLFLFPCPRRQIILGKNLAMFTVLSVINLVYVAILAGLAQALAWFGLLYFWMELAVLVCIALGNVASIYFPYRMVMRGWRIRQQSASRGCGYTLIYLLVMALAFVLLLPVTAALAIPIFWTGMSWLLLTLPLALLYAGGLYWISLVQAVPLLRQRELDIIAKVSQED
jgi:ABC-2 type transport system permease protein